jgi:magnesium transporter
LIAVDPEKPLDDIDKSLELDVFIGKNYIVTYHPEEIKAVDVIWEFFQRDNKRLIKGSNYLLYHIVDEIANGYMALIDRVDLEVETIEDEVMKKPDNRLLERIFSIKRTLLNLRRIVAPQREVLNKMSRGDFEVIGQKERMYYRDVYDHLVRVHDITESLRDLVSGALDTYLSVVNNRLNDIMKTLTIITTLFMPLSFLTGFFGLDLLTSHFAFYVVAVIFVLLPLGMFIWMRKRNWM